MKKKAKTAKKAPKRRSRSTAKVAPLQQQISDCKKLFDAIWKSCEPHSPECAADALLSVLLAVAPTRQSAQEQQFDRPDALGHTIGEWILGLPVSPEDKGRVISMILRSSGAHIQVQRFSTPLGSLGGTGGVLN